MCGELAAAGLQQLKQVFSHLSLLLQEHGAYTMVPHVSRRAMQYLLMDSSGRWT